MRTMMITMMVMTTTAANTLIAQEYVANIEKSSLKWHGKKVTGEHYGYINLKEGRMMMENDRITGGKFVIDMTSITNTDLTDESYNQKLVGHLKSDDFFGVAKHPEAFLEIVKSETFKNNEAKVDAKLTIKNITHPITFTAKRDGDLYSAEIVVDRSKYDVRYGSGSFFDNLGNNLIYDNFTMTVKLNVNPANTEES